MNPLAILGGVAQTGFDLFKSGWEIEQAKRENEWRDQAVEIMRPLGEQAKTNINEIGQRHTDADRQVLEDVYGKSAGNLTDYARQYFRVPGSVGRPQASDRDRAIYDDFSRMLQRDGGQWNDPRFRQLGQTGIGTVGGQNYTYQDFLNARDAVEGLSEDMGAGQVLNAIDPRQGQMSRFANDALAQYSSEIGGQIGQLDAEIVGTHRRYNKAVDQLGTTAAHNIAVAESPLLSAGAEALAKMYSRPDVGSPQWQREYDATRLDYTQKAATNAGAMAETTRINNLQTLTSLNANLDSALQGWQAQRGTLVKAVADTSLGVRMEAFQQDVGMLDKFRGTLDKLNETRFQAETSINQNLAQWQYNAEQARLTGDAHTADLLAGLQGSVIQFNPFNSAMDNYWRNRQGELQEQTNDATRDAARTSLWGNLIPQTQLNATIPLGK